MTNETVIAILSELKKCYLGGIVDALDFAIEAVKTQEHEALDMPKPDSDIGCWYDMTHNYTLEQVVNALKAQEARVMTLEEVQSCENAMWIEFLSGKLSGKGFYAFVLDRMKNGILEISTRAAYLRYYSKDYNIKWRCWTLRPTDE